MVLVFLVLGTSPLVRSRFDGAEEPPPGATTYRIGGEDAFAVERGGDPGPDVVTVLFLHGQAYTSDIWLDRGIIDALSDAGVRTLVLEAGGLTLPTHMTSLPGDWSRAANHHRVGHFVNEPGSDFLPGVHLSLGGRSVYWSGLIPRMRPWELAFWPQPVRDFLDGLDWDKTPPPPPLPDEVVASTSARYVEAYERITGRAFSDWPGVGA